MKPVVQWVSDHYAALAAILVIMIVVDHGLLASPILAREYADGAAFGAALLLGIGLLALLIRHASGERKG